MVARHPTPEELAAWEVLTTAARAHAEEVIAMTDARSRLPSAERLIKARRAVRNAVLPVGQQMRGAPMSELVRLIDRWAVMSSYDRTFKAAELRDTAINAATLAGFAP